MTRRRSLRYTPPADQQPSEPVEPLVFVIREVDPEVDDVPGSNGDMTEARRLAELMNEERTFTAVDELPGFVSLDLGEASDDEVPEARRMHLLKRVILAMVVSGDRLRFERFLREAIPAIRADELLFYVQQVLEEISGRPTEGQQPSAGSLPRTATGSTAAGGSGTETPV